MGLSAIQGAGTGLANRTHRVCIRHISGYGEAAVWVCEDDEAALAMCRVGRMALEAHKKSEEAGSRVSPGDPPSSPSPGTASTCDCGLD
jgi:hypothetical protein